MVRIPLFAAALPIIWAGTGQTPAVMSAPHAAPSTATSLLSIHLERSRNGHTETMRPDHVFETGDIVRFRLTAGQDGYLYVLDQGSSGSYSTLFPAPGGTAHNRIQRGAEYTVPSTGDGWFAIDPPAGFDTVYFLLSPVPLATMPAGGAATPAAPERAAPETSTYPPLNPALKPRCNDAIFRARGECVDSSAGPAPLPRDAVLPPQITLAAPHASRDIVLASDDDGTVSASATGTQPVVYIFRLAHQ